MYKQEFKKLLDKQGVKKMTVAQFAQFARLMQQPNK